MNSKMMNCTGPYEMWLAAQVMQALLRSGSYPLKTNDALLAEKIIRQIRKKWGLSCRVDHDRVMEPVPVYIIKTDADKSEDRELLLSAIDVIRELLVKGSSRLESNEADIKKTLEVINTRFDFSCTAEPEPDTNGTLYLIVRC